MTGLAVPADALAERLLARDATLWPEGSEAPHRLGWLDIASRLLAACAEVSAWASSLSYERVVLLGMGGSSLGPEVLRAAAQSDRLVVCDTTDPKTVAAVPVDGSFFLLSSKSGGTLEPRALFSHFWDRVPDGSRWAAVCDPGTKPIELARLHDFARVFENDPNIGGRYSVLSWFGLVPAALLGLDPAELCRRARTVDVEEAVRMGVGWAEAQQAGRDKLTILLGDGPFRAFGLWAEQLVAESLGKRGTGIVPVPTTDVEAGADREHVVVHLEEVYDLGPEFLRWEIATATAGSLLRVDAFDQPDVEAAKVATAAALEDLPLPADLPEGVDVAAPDGLVPWLDSRVSPGDYVALQAYVPYGQDAALEALRRRIREALGGIAVTAGYGPRFLHSTGQLHKGGPGSCVAVQIVPTAPTATVPVPDHDYDFGTLLAAQALGDLQALRAAGRRVVRISVDAGALSGIAEP
ncbi:MAG: Glucose-6-phosphate isomerase [uncultured Acidimicrobiales bacterium]|uniref:Glucose-6-phosphate isomerase n=1 Tax=uncultured Acidimicrobiales bacterium TaxID=310071 RepID=A0A6J4H505_9ACTN|nr:MAG: Glucose-6-phosphate isomerase [uncultured Acidimicrobiales bacterium]